MSGANQLSAVPDPVERPEAVVREVAPRGLRPLSSADSNHVPETLERVHGIDVNRLDEMFAVIAMHATSTAA